MAGGTYPVLCVWGGGASDPPCMPMGLGVTVHILQRGMKRSDLYGLICYDVISDKNGSCLPVTEDMPFTISSLSPPSLRCEERCICQFECFSK